MLQTATSRLGPSARRTPPPAVLPLRDLGIEGIPTFRRNLTATPGHKLELSQELQYRMALLEVDTDRVIVIVDEEFRDNPEFDNLCARARGAGLLILNTVTLPYSRVQLLSQAMNGAMAAVKAGKANTHTDNLLNELLEEGVRLRASDVHIVIRDDELLPAEARSLRVQLRIDGRLQMHRHLSNINYAKSLRDMIQVVYGVKGDAGSNSEGNFSADINQYLTITRPIGGQMRTLRYQSFKIQHGNRYVIRIPDERESESTDMAALNYLPSQLRLLRQIARQKYGATLFCGTVNTGKTTSMQRMVLNTPHADELHIASLEDPIEGHVMGHKVSRIAIQRGAETTGRGGNPFAAPIRDLLRGDIDVFYMGEIRDRETASAFEAAIQTGHKGLATLHLGSAFSAIPRLSASEIGISRESIASEDFLTAIICQRLLPKLCPEPGCAIPVKELMTNPDALDDDQREALIELETRFKVSLDKVRTRRIGGDCPHCHGRGTIDRVLIAEVVVPDTHMFKLWRLGRDVDAKEYWRKKRVKPFDHPDMTGKTAFEHGIYLVSQGVIDPFELDAIVPLARYEVLPLVGM